jgi:crossover junction endodeoxyribonuclease RusA
VASYSIIVEGRPVPKGRPRLARNGGVYTPKTTVEYEVRVSNAWFEKYGSTALEGKLVVWCFFATDRHGKQDVDNLAKSVLDGLQRAGAFAQGDEQVYKLTASKFPSDTLSTTICVRELVDYDTGD